MKKGVEDFILSVMGIVMFFLILVIIFQFVETNPFDCSELCGVALQRFLDSFFTRRYIPITLIILALNILTIVYMSGWIKNKEDFVDYYKECRLIFKKWWYVFLVIFIIVYLSFRFYKLFFRFYELLPLLVIFGYIVTFLWRSVSKSSGLAKSLCELNKYEYGGRFDSIKKEIIYSYIVFISFSLVLSLLIVFYLFPKNIFSPDNFPDNVLYIVAAYSVLLALLIIAELASDSFILKKVLVEVVIKSFNGFYSGGIWNDIRFSGGFEGYINIKLFAFYRPTINFYFKIDNPKGIEVKKDGNRIVANMDEVLEKIDEIGINIKKLNKFEIKGNRIYAEVPYYELINANIVDEVLRKIKEIGIDGKLNKSEIKGNRIYTKQPNELIEASDSDNICTEESKGNSSLTKKSDSSFVLSDERYISLDKKFEVYSSYNLIADYYAKLLKLASYIDNKSLDDIKA
ncbi:MAG: hypothetical protein ACP5PA_00650 [Elusimicrobiales bacterium]